MEIRNANGRCCFCVKNAINCAKILRSDPASLASGPLTFSLWIADSRESVRVFSRQRRVSSRVLARISFSTDFGSGAFAICSNRRISRLLRPGKRSRHHSGKLANCGSSPASTRSLASFSNIAAKTRWSSALFQKARIFSATTSSGLRVVSWEVSIIGFDVLARERFVGLLI